MLQSIQRKQTKTGISIDTDVMKLVETILQCTGCTHKKSAASQQYEACNGRADLRCYNQKIVQSQDIVHATNGYTNVPQDTCPSLQHVSTKYDTKDVLKCVQRPAQRHIYTMMAEHLSPV